MKLLVTSFHFHPLTGGISTSSLLLAREFVRLGHEVRVITTTPAESGTPADLGVGRVVRNPTRLELMQHIAWCDAVVSIHLSLRLNWPLLLFRRPWVVAHHSWLTNVAGGLGWTERLKHRLVRIAHCISVSRAVAQHVGGRSVVIGPPHDDALFVPNPATPRNQDLLFVGRLVSSKGVNVLLDAIERLRHRGTPRKLTVVGDGPERPALVAKVHTLGLESLVTFVGERQGAALRETFCAHNLLVVPSVTPETFGIVAVEAIACGCVVIGSAEAGGLTDAIGPCGITFPTGDANALADAIGSLLDTPGRLEPFRVSAADHVSQFTAPGVAARYLEVVQAAVAQRWVASSTAILSTWLAAIPT